MATHLPTQNLSTNRESFLQKSEGTGAPGALWAEGVHPPCDLLGVGTGTATASVNPSVSEQAPDQWRQPLVSNSVRKPSSSRGVSSFTGKLHCGQGAPAAPQVQACSPSHGRAGWFSHTQPQSSHREHFMACRAYPDFRHESPVMFDSATLRVRANGLVGRPDVCRPADGWAKGPFLNPKETAPARGQAEAVSWGVCRGATHHEAHCGLVVAAGSDRRTVVSSRAC